MTEILKSKKLDNVCYDIRGPILDTAQRMEEEGQQITKLHIGNPATFGFQTPDEILHDVIHNLPNATGYCESKGLFSARKAIMQYYQKKGVLNLNVEDIFIGNGVSELICMAMQGLLNNNDEILVPAPDYPLWTAAVTLAGGKPIHYICDEAADWFPDIADITKKITPQTKAILLINPNNPTGALYSKALILDVCRIAQKHNLVIFADEIYDQIIYDDAEFNHVSALADEDSICITFNGLSKNYRAAGFRSGWMTVTGNKKKAKSYIEGLNILASMRLCSNVPSQYAIQTALGGYQSINDLIQPGGRLYEQRNHAYELLSAIPGLSCVKPKAALYLFPKIDTKKFPNINDEKFVLSLLAREKILVVQGTAFNWPYPDHFRMVFLPYKTELSTAFARIKHFMENPFIDEWS